MKRLLGYFFVSLPFLAVLTLCLISIGLIGTLIVLGGCAFIVGSITLGTSLLFQD